MWIQSLLWVLLCLCLSVFVSLLTQVILIKECCEKLFYTNCQFCNMSPAWQNQQNGFCTERRLGSAWAEKNIHRYIMWIMIIFSSRCDQIRSFLPCATDDHPMLPFEQKYYRLLRLSPFQLFSYGGFHTILSLAKQNLTKNANLMVSYWKHSEQLGHLEHCLSLVVRKPVFRVCGQGRLKPACSVTEAR